MRAEEALEAIRFCDLLFSFLSIRSASAAIGDVIGWSDVQMAKLKAKAVTVYGEVSKWTPEQLREAGTVIGKDKHC